MVEGMDNTKTKKKPWKTQIRERETCISLEGQVFNKMQVAILLKNCVINQKIAISPNNHSVFYFLLPKYYCNKSNKLCKLTSNSLKTLNNNSLIFFLLLFYYNFSP